MYTILKTAVERGTTHVWSAAIQYFIAMHIIYDSFINAFLISVNSYFYSFEHVNFIHRFYAYEICNGTMYFIQYRQLIQLRKLKA